MAEAKIFRRQAIDFTAAPSGGGKTFHMVRRADRMTKEGRNVLLLQPTKLLIEKTRLGEFGRLSDPPPIRVFHGDSVGRNVAYQLAEYLADPEDRPQVVMATHQALPRTPFLSNASSWDLLIDEVPQVDREQAHIVPNTHPLITDHIRVVQHDGLYGRVVLTSPEAVRALARNPDEDELLEKFRETADTLIAKHWQSFVHIEQYQKLLIGKAKALNIHSVLMPSLVGEFASVLIAGANFEDTGLFALWSKMGVNFVPDVELAEGLRYRKHGNGNLTTIHYGDGVLSIKIAENAHLKTYNNSVSDYATGTLIKANSSIYRDLLKLKVGETVRFSGTFFAGGADCFQELSMTLQGSITDPEFLFRFSRVERVIPLTQSAGR